MFGIYNCYVEHTTVMKNGKFARYRGVDTCYFDQTNLSDEYCFNRERHPVTKGAIAKETRVHFTENEIKEIDERYWLFAVPVEKEASSILEALKKI